MPLVKEKDLLNFAEENHFAVPGFFAFNLDFIKPIIEVAEEERAPSYSARGRNLSTASVQIFLPKPVKPQLMAQAFRWLFL